MKKLTKISRVAVIGIGLIGKLVIKLLRQTDRYNVVAIDKQQINVADSNFIACDISNYESFKKVLKENQTEAVVSCLPFFANMNVAKAAKDLNLYYFDLTEDVETTEYVKTISKDATTAFVPQCGLAPGFVNIVAHSIAKKFKRLDTIKLRVGSLPIASSNALKYLFTWSIEGVINEYCEPCKVIINGKNEYAPSLDGLESIFIDGQEYECFNTSGGVGSLTETYAKRVKNLMYKTIRYPGHCEIMRWLINDLKLGETRDLLIDILKKAIPVTQQDVVLIFVSVVGEKENGILFEESYVNRIYGQKIDGVVYSAIQTTTAGSLCAVIDKVLTNPDKYRGFIKQEDFSIEDVLDGPFGFCYQREKGA